MIQSRTKLSVATGVLLVTSLGCLRPAARSPREAPSPAGSRKAPPVAPATLAKEVKEPRAVVVRKSEIDAGPHWDAPALATVNCGDVVHLLGDREGHRVKIDVGGVTGWVYDSDVLGLSAPGAPARMLAAAQERERPSAPWTAPDYLSALALYSRLIELLPGSDYEALALWRFGQVGKRLAVEAMNRAEKELTDEQKRSDESFIRWTGLDRYRQWGLSFEFSHLGHRYFHGGDAYRSILKDYPDSEWADNAAFELVRLKPCWDQEWEGHPKGPQEYLDMLIEFTKNYPRGDTRPQAMLEMVYVNRVLYEMRSHESARKEFVNQAKAHKYRQAAERICGDILREFPATEYAAEAERNLAHLKEGQTVYCGAIGRHHSP